MSNVQLAGEHKKNGKKMMVAKEDQKLLR